MADHKYIEGHDLSVCEVCGAYEGGLTTECPGVKVRADLTDLVYDGKLDFVEGEWQSLAVSRHCPAGRVARWKAARERAKLPPTPMSPEEFARRMKEVDCGCPETSHGDMDNLMVEVLRSLGYGEGCDVFETAPKWYA